MDDTITCQPVDAADTQANVAAGSSSGTSGDSGGMDGGSADAMLHALGVRYETMLNSHLGDAQAVIEAMRAAVRAEVDDEFQRHARELAAMQAGFEADVASVREAAQSEIDAERRRCAEAIEAARQETEARIDEARQAIEAELRASAAEHLRQLQEVRRDTELEIDAVMRGIESSAASQAEMQAELEGRIASGWEFERATSQAHAGMAKQVREELMAVAEAVEASRDPAETRGLLLDLDNSIGALASSLGCQRMLAQLMSGTSALEQTTFDLVRLVRDVAQNAEPMADLSKVVVAASVPDRELLVVADESRIAYSLLSLVLNAIKHSPHGSTVGISLIDDGGEAVQVRIEDQGVGIAPARLEALRQCLDHPGGAIHDGRVGLGIPIAMALARQHGGQLQIESSIGRGTQATLELPGSLRRAGGQQAQAAS